MQGEGTGDPRRSGARAPRRLTPMELLAEAKKLDLNMPSEAAEIVRKMRDERYGGLRSSMPSALVRRHVRRTRGREDSAPDSKAQGSLRRCCSAFEIVNVCLTRLRRYPDRRVGILQAFALQGGLSRSRTAEVDHAGYLDAC